MNLSIQNVRKSYEKGRKLALENFSVELKAGVYGLLGPNGAGKSTLMNIITDNLKPDSGEVQYNGHNILQLGKLYRDVLGYMPQHQGLYPDFTGNRFLWYMAALKGLSKKKAKERIDYLLHIVNLQRDANKKIGSYSGGMKQRILIAQALLNDPEILILDEPTAGLDPKERVRLRNFIATIALNKIVILATHVVSDIEYIAKEVLFLKQGKLVLQDEPARILERMQDNVFEVHIAEADLSEFQRLYKISNITSERDGLCVRIVGDHAPAGMQVCSVRPNLEEVYLYMFDE
jgi:ABC-2 type transport system ATP-binding protein